MSKGQFPLAIIGLIVMSLIWRMPPEDISALVFRIVDGSARGALLGYFFALIAMAGWYLHARHQRRVIAAALERVAAKRRRA
jgi:integral membrane sensor domain MASE1